MTKTCKYNSSNKSTEDCINDLCHELRTSLQIISGISENALEFPTTTTTNLKNKNSSRYYNEMAIINKNCERLSDKVESCISTMRTQSECLQYIDAPLQHKKLEKEKCNGCYFSNKLIIDKKEIVIPF